MRAEGEQALAFLLSPSLHTANLKKDTLPHRSQRELRLVTHALLLKSDY